MLLQLQLPCHPHHGTKRRICNKFANVQICCKFNIQICINFAVVVLLSLRHPICNTYTHAFTHTQIYGIKFAADLQWLFYYLTIPNLQYIHSYLFTYANFLDQICIRFAMVGFLSLLYQICNTYTHTFAHTQIFLIKLALNLQGLFIHNNFLLTCKN